jgi:hypothetical protein
VLQLQHVHQKRLLQRIGALYVRAGGEELRWALIGCYDGFDYWANAFCTSA